MQDILNSRMNIKDQISSLLATLRPRILSNGFTRQAAVLMPIFEQQGEYHLLLTKRTEEVQTHKGQISFPGGMREADEDLITTALRETFEEVGIEANKIEILGRFHDYISITGYRVTPFVGFIGSSFETRAQSREVAEILRVPFSVFLNPACMRIKKSKIKRTGKHVYCYTYGSHEIWGLTARIIKDFFAALKSHV